MKSIDRSKRRKRTAEDFTPPKLVNEILDRLSLDSNNTVWEESETFCDPACGNGNFLTEVLKRKLDKGHDPATAIGTVYGADIMADNIRECRYRLLTILKERGVTITEKIARTVLTNIVWVSMKKKGYEKGSLDYDFSFNGKNIEGNDSVVQAWLRYMEDPASVKELELKDKSARNSPKTLDA